MNKVLLCYPINLWSNILRLFDLSPPRKLDRRINDFNWSLNNEADSAVWSLSPAKIMTFRIRPPSVTISARRGLKGNGFSISMSWGMRSTRSSQQTDAFTTDLPPSSFSNTAISSASEGNASLHFMISDVCCFNSLTRSTTIASSEALSVCNYSTYLQIGKIKLNNELTWLL